MTPKEIRAMMQANIEWHGTAAAWARDIGVSPQYVGDVLHGRREPAGRILTALGLERIVTYRKRNGRAK